MKRYIRASSAETFSSKMKLINKLLKQGTVDLNREDILFLFGKADHQLAEELRYLGCEVTKVADLFNVKLPETPFTKDEISKQEHIEKMY